LNNPVGSFPGTPQHQALLQAITSYYEQDRRVQAVILFGSLVRGDWDAWSDLDLDVIFADGDAFNVLNELEALRLPLASAGEKIVLILPDGPQEGDVVLESLMRFSIRYHTLEDTSPNILDSMQLLAGSLDRTAIMAAGWANRRPAEVDLSLMVDRFLYYAVVAKACLCREQAWTTVEILHRMRNLLLELYALTHAAPRAYKMFDARASAGIQQRFGKTLPGTDQPSLHRALFSLLIIIEDDLDILGNGRLRLTPEQIKILAGIRKAC
jgi:predicted nucleotidyltransferase